MPNTTYHLPTTKYQLPSLKPAFALPSIVIASVIMMSVLSITMASITSSRNALKDQKYTQLAQLAAESGQSYAKACLDKNNNIPTWSNTKPLKPNTDCLGNETTTCTDSSTNQACFITIDTTNNLRSSFTVNLPTIDSSNKVTAIPSTGTVKLIRSSSGLAWKTYNQSIGVKQTSTQEQYNEATGGTITEFISTGQAGTTIGKRYRVHTFTSSGTLNITKADKPFDVLVVGGGGGVGYWGWAGGGGAGGFVQTQLTLLTGSINVVVGAGGTGSSSVATSGGNSAFDSIVAYGGGRGGSEAAPTGASGGSGGAGALNNSGGAGTYGQGYSGASGGHGGGGGAGGQGSPYANGAQNGGPGLSSYITGINSIYSAGGSGGTMPINGEPGTGNGGSGGTGAGPSYGGSGGAGIVIVRYEIDNSSTSSIVASGLQLYLDAGDQSSYRTKNITKAKIYSVYSGLRSANYTVQYSDNNSSWTTAFSGVMSNNSSFGIQEGTNPGNGSYGAHRYWRYIEGSSIVSHHPRTSRIILTDVNNVDYNIVVYAADNTSDQGGYQIGTVNWDAPGTTWYDLSGNSNNVTLNNSPSWNSSLSGYFSTGSTGWFSGNGTTGIPIGNSAYTMQVWVRIPNSWTDGRGFVSIGGFGATNQSNAFRTRYNSVGGMTNYWWSNDLPVSNNNANLNINVWFMATAEFDGVTRKLWANITNVGSDQPTGHNVQTSAIQIAKTYDTEYLQGDISAVLIYNRALSDAEITQNYNALKSRYGL